MAWTLTGGHALWLASALLLTGTVSAAGSQNWYPDSTGTIHDTAYRGTEPDSWHVTVNDGAEQMWRADEGALTDVNFGPGDWSFHLKLVDPFYGTFRLHVGIYDPETDLYAWAGSTTVTNHTGLTYSGSIPLGEAGDFTVPKGDYLAFRLENTADASTGNSTIDRKRVIDLETGTVETRFTSPESDPGYPAPELPAILLTGVGLLGLAAHRVWRQR